jgi:hypothetical protein
MNVVVWLRSLGLGEYEAAFRENEIDGAVLPDLTAEDLKDLGVSIVGDRRKILARYRRGNSNRREVVARRGSSDRWRNSIARTGAGRREGGEALRTCSCDSTQQQANSWELRAAMSRLRRDQGKMQQAREFIAPAYGWFTEGFDTGDLKQAKVLLEELAS